MDVHILVGFQLRKNASNLKRITIIKIGLLPMITLNHIKGDFYGITGFLCLHSIIKKKEDYEDIGLNVFGYELFE